METLQSKRPCAPAGRQGHRVVEAAPAAFKTRNLPLTADAAWQGVKTEPARQWQMHAVASAYATCPAGAQRAVFQSCADAVCQSNA